MACRLFGAKLFSEPMLICYWLIVNQTLRNSCVYSVLPYIHISIWNVFFANIRLKLSSAKYRQFCRCPNVLILQHVKYWWHIFVSSRWWLGQNGLNLTRWGGVYHRVYRRIWWWSKCLYLTLLALKPGYFTDNYANAIATDYMATQGARASRAMVLTRKYLSTKFIFYMSGICTKTRYTVHG